MTDFTDNRKRYGLKKRRRLGALLFVCILCLCGCGQAVMDPLVDPLYIDTAGVERATVLVKRGNLAPVYQREIELSGYGEMAYRVEKDLLYKLETQYEASVDELHVEVGDRVKEGDVLLSFSSEVLEDRLSDSERTLRHAKLDIEHYRKLEDIDPLSDYRNEIGDLEDDSTLAKLYIEDVEKTYAEINVISTGEGVVSFVDPSVLDGFLKVGTPMIKVIQDDGYYTCDLDDHSELHAGEDQVDFSPGQHFIARSMFAEFEVETIEKPTGEVSGNSVDGDNIVYFKLVGVDENAIKEKKLTIYKELKEIKNVLYVEQAALIHPADTIQSFGAAPSDVNDGYYVYKMQDDGTFRVQKVVPGDLCGKYIVIKEGLEEGDVVSIPADAVESETQEQETGSASSGGGHDHNHDDDYDSFPGWGPVTVSSVPKGNK